jgi:hypothetical protein
LKVSAPNEEPVCFDVSDTDESVLSLISEGPGGVQVNGQVIKSLFYKNKNHILRYSRKEQREKFADWRQLVLSHLVVYRLRSTLTK